MRGVMFLGEQQVEIVELPDPHPGAGEVVIEVQASGMCGSDLHSYRGPKIDAPVVGGHEPSGYVVEVGSSVSSDWLGKAVMVHHYFGCEQCDQCRAGWTQLCRSGARAMGATAPGAHSEYIVVPSHTLVAMPEGLSFLAAAAIGCGTGTAWGALNRLQLRGTESIAIFGQGPVGLAATQLAVAQGAKVIALDISEARRRQAVDLGAAHVVNPAEVDSVADVVRELNGGRGVEKSLDTSGASSAANAAVGVLDLWGSVCWVGVGAHLSFDVTDLLYRQITTMTSWTMSKMDMERCARFVAERRVDVDALFTESWELNQAAEAYRHFATQSSGKGAFIPPRAEKV